MPRRGCSTTPAADRGEDPWSEPGVRASHPEGDLRASAEFRGRRVDRNLKVLDLDDAGATGAAGPRLPMTSATRRPPHAVAGRSAGSTAVTATGAESTSPAAGVKYARLDLGGANSLAGTASGRARGGAEDKSTGGGITGADRAERCRPPTSVGGGRFPHQLPPTGGDAPCGRDVAGSASDRASKNHEAASASCLGPGGLCARRRPTAGRRAGVRTRNWFSGAAMTQSSRRLESPAESATRWLFGRHHRPARLCFEAASTAGFEPPRQAGVALSAQARAPEPASSAEDRPSRHHGDGWPRRGRNPRHL